MTDQYVPQKIKDYLKKCKIMKNNIDSNKNEI